MKVEIFDPAMCCSSGLCGPAIDPLLVRVNDAVMALKRRASRWNATTSPSRRSSSFRTNP